MKAIVQPTYGSPDDLQLRDIDQPTIGDHDVLVRVHAASVNTADRLILRGRPYLMRAAGSGLGFSPRRPQFAVAGTDLAGRVAAVGSLVTAFRPGDEVYGSVPGAIAEYVAAPDTALAAKPSSLSFQQAAAMPLAALTALQGLRDAGQVQPGQRVLINGASGGVGTYAVQIAKVLGAEVTAVTSGPNVEMVRSLGADHVIDYTSEDFTESASRYDAILDLAGNHSTVGSTTRADRDGHAVAVVRRYQPLGGAALPDEESRDRCTSIAQALRARGIACEVAPEPRKFGRQIRFAEQRGIPFVWFPGDPDEVKDIRSGDQVPADAGSWRPSENDLRPQVISQKVGQ